MRIKIGFQILAISAIISANAWAYGTVRKNGIIPQNLEHERITRRAFSCDATNPVPHCFSRKTLDKMAGKKRWFYGTFGGVGYPDKPVGTKIETDHILTNYDYMAVDERPQLGQSLPSIYVAHCDGGDFLAEVDGYPRTEDQAKNMIIGCRQWMSDHFAAAVEMAAGLVRNGKIVGAETKLRRNCITWKQAGSTAKCNVLTHFGILLHASQDFYSHSNWVDRPAQGGLSSTNPPGLGSAGPAPWLAMPITDVEFPQGLISGCWDGWPEGKNCNDANGDGVIIRRAKHMDINKDSGIVDPKPNAKHSRAYEGVGEIGPGVSTRGKINENFERSVQAAILDTRAKLGDFEAALEMKYGGQDAALMMCALTKDKPSKDC